ncbi:hypothetical protein C8J57DRAFT_1219540 [Mycena rebaudengoi]|nr:hypothetical protein C8J57DRAFT_1219540 [Mycena rebaudengoi]
MGDTWWITMIWSWLVRELRCCNEVASGLEAVRGTVSVKVCISAVWLSRQIKAAPPISIPSVINSVKRAGVVAYIEGIVSPFGSILNKAIPSAASTPNDIQQSVKMHLQEFVGAYLSSVWLIHVIALEVADTFDTDYHIPPEAVVSLYLMQKFHMFLERPSYGQNLAFEKDMLDRVDIMLRHAHDSRTRNTDPIDVAMNIVIASIPAIPSWTTNTIQVLLAQECVDPWIGEKYYLSE